MNTVKIMLRLLAAGLLCALCACGSGGGNVETGLIPVKSGDVFGYIDLEGKYVINPQFDSAFPFTDGLALVKKGDLFGYIDEKGTYVIAPKYIRASSFTNNVAWTVEKGGAPTLIDKDGEPLVILKDAESVWPYSEGLAKFERAVSDTRSKYGYVNLKGEVVIPPVYDSAEPFSEGLAAVTDGNTTIFIDKSGKTVICDSLIENNIPFNNGYAIVKNRGGDVGTIDTKGKFVINPQFKEMITDGDLFTVMTHGNSGSNYGWCDKNGKFVINPQFAEAIPFGTADLAPVKIGGSWGYIDRKGKIVINPQFDSAFPFIDNKLAVVETGGKYGLIDKEGKYAVNPQFTGVSDFYLVLTFLPTNYIAQYQRIKSEYFNIDGAIDLVMKDIGDAGIDGITFKTPLSKILKKYDKSENDLYRYAGIVRLADYALGRDLSGEIGIDGDFFRSVSDGWWGTTQVIVGSATPTSIHYTLSTRGRSVGKQKEIMDALAKRMGLKDYEGRYGKSNVILMEMAEGVDILMTPGGKGNDTGRSEVADSTVIMEEPVGDKIVYEGKIDNKYGIVMTLYVNDSSVHGSYYYTSKKSPITLEGSINYDDKICLEESVKGKTTGRFVGSYSPQEISGTWISDDGSKEMPFAVTVK